MYGMKLTTEGLPTPGSYGPVPPVRGDAAKRAGFVAGTLISTSMGLRPVEDLTVGDKIGTFDSGLQPIVEIRRFALATTTEQEGATGWPVTVPAGTLGNLRDMVVMPDQGLMVGSENARDVMGDPFAVVPVCALEGLCGIRRSAPRRQTEFFTLVFAREEVIYADGGQLLHCEAAEADRKEDASAPSLYDVKTASQAQEMLTDLDLAELVLEEERNEVLMRGRTAHVA